MNLLELSPPELLALHAKVADELRTRGITRSAKSPTGDLAEYLFCKAFGWKQVGNSQANVDAIGPDMGIHPPILMHPGGTPEAIDTSGSNVTWIP